MMYEELREKAKQLRRDTLQAIYEGGSGHPGGSLSAMELLVALYYGELKNISSTDPYNVDRDRFILSKGHACPALYAILADKGYFPKEDLKTLRHVDSHLQGQPDRKKTLGVDACAGSLGQAVSVGVGMALGAKKAGKNLRVYVILGDGELQEGQPWEAFMSAAHYDLDNITFIIDNNGLQIDGTNEEVMSLGNLADKMRSFGMETIEIEDGHNFEMIFDAFSAPHCKKPKAIVAHTVKGKGVSYMENVVYWHGAAPNEEQLEQAMEELK